MPSRGRLLSPRHAAVLLPLLAPALLALLPARADNPTPPAKVDFVKDVQPIFRQHCYSCHGPDKQRSGLRLDRKRDALRGGDSGPFFVQGKGADSLLVHWVTGKDGSFMPPKGERLTAAQVATLKAWIDQGATWPEDAVATADPRKHWAFQPPARPAAPAVRDAAWPRTPIDRFILARLENEGLRPAPEADKVTLIRRLALDLTGLPPTPKEVEDFLADTGDDAYATVVERLLASPHYGERWGRHWLDAARYADSDGYEKDKSRQVWFYRDWVIAALNRDLPYDRFVIEQIAGDLLPNATQDQVVATGFLRMSMLNEEGGVDPEQFRMDAMFDRADAVGRAVLGLSVACAQCHNHKFDPLTQEEYYRLFAYLNNDHEAQRVVHTPAGRAKIADLRAKIKAAEDKLRADTPDWAERLARWEAGVNAARPTWHTVTVTNQGDNGQRYEEQKDGSVLVHGYAPTKSTGHFAGPSPVTKVRAFRLELFNDPNLPCNGPGRSFMGTCALTDFRVEAVDAKDPKKKVAVKFAAAAADYGNPERPLEPNFDDRSGKKRVTGPVAFAIDGKDETAWGIDAGPGRRNAPRVAVFVADKDLEPGEGATLHFYLKQNHGGWNSDDHMNNNLGRFRLSVTDSLDAAADALPPAVRAALDVHAAKRTPAQAEAVFAHWRTTVPAWDKENAAIEALWQEWPAGATTLTLQARDEPRVTHLLKRGDFLKPGKEVTAGVPAFLHPLADKDAPPTRLTLARWLADRRSPTTARAFVNRTWQTYFGTGLVATPEEFGTQGDKPSHPELLDLLAVEFMEPTAALPGEGGKAAPWSVKHLHRLIVHSATYRQSSRVTAAALEKDPSNRLCGRGPRLRVEAEVVRDIALAASGLLNPKVGGPSVFAPAPQFLFKPPASYGPFEWVEATGPEKYRRALYTFRRRSTPYPALQNFDAPPGEASCVRRPRSNTPLMALTTLNEEIFVECARGLAARALRDGGTTDDDRVTYAFRLCVSRPPTDREKAVLLKLLEGQRKRVEAGELDAKEIATGSKDAKAKSPDGVKAADLASYALVCRVLLNLDETITKE